MSELKALAQSLHKKELLLPLLSDFLLKESLSIRAKKLSKKAPVIEDAKLTIECFRKRIEEFNHGEDPEGEFFHPSALGGCMRASWFSALKAPSKSPGKRDVIREYMTFEQGTYLHVVIQNLCARAGVLVKREIAIQDELNKTLGHADGVVKIDGVKYVLEIKSSNSRNFTMLGNAPKFGHLLQLHDYMKCLGIPRGIFVYIDKDRGTLREFVVEFDESLYAEHVRRRKRMFFKRLRSLKPPKREGLTPGAPPCSYCQFADICFSSTTLAKFIRQKKREKGIL